MKVALPLSVCPSFKGTPLILAHLLLKQETAIAAYYVCGWQQPWIQVTTADDISSHTGNVSAEKNQSGIQSYSVNI